MSDKLDTIGERLNYARKQVGKTYNQLVELIGEGKVTGSALSTAFTRNTIKDVYVNILCEKLGVNKEWVKTGVGEIFINNTGSNAREVKQIPFEEFMEAEYLPVTAQAGYLGSLEGVVDMDLQTILVPKEFEKGNYTVVEITGPSMDDGSTRAICDGDKLLVKQWENTSKQLPYRHSIFIIVSKEGIVCKQVIKHDVESGVISCRSFNPKHTDYDISMNDVYKIFVVNKIVERRIKL